MTLPARIVTFASTTALVVVLSGCGSTPPPKPSAAPQIDDARRAMDSAKNWEKQNQLDLALQELRKAKDAISEGKAIAEGSELSQLQDMDDDVRRLNADLQTRKITQVKPVEAPKPVAVAAAKVEDPEEKKRRELEAETKKREAEAAEAKKQLDENLKASNVSVKKADKKDDEAEVAAAAKKPAAGGSDKAGGAADGDEKPEAAADPNAGKGIKPASGPFPAITEKSPPLAIAKLAIKGKFAIAYIQAYNPQENGKRIMAVSVAFRDANNNALINPQQVITFQYDGFKADVKDPSDQAVAAITQGSHQLIGFDGLRMAAVGQSDRVNDIRKVQVKLIFNDGTDAFASGPDGGVEAPATIPGVRLK